MLKAQVLRRHFSLFNRVPYARIARSAARDGHESVTIHRVRIGKPFLNRSRIVGTVVVATTFWSLSRYISIEVKEVKADEATPVAGQVSNGGEEEEGQEDDDYDDALVFLPTGFSRPRPQTYYKGSDPEWQEFKKIVMDRPRVEKIRDEFTTMMRSMASKSAPWVAKLGAIDEKKGKVWLEIRFPDGPPIEYERPGIELTEDLEWRKATRPVADMHHKRLSRVLYPTEVANALYQDTKRKAELSWKGVRALMGWGEPPAPETLLNVAQKRIANPALPPSAEVSGTPTATSPPASIAPNSKQSTESASSLSAQFSELGFVLPDPKTLMLDLSNFRQTFRKSVKPLQVQAPRGTFMVLGLIEIRGTRASMTLNVSAAYDPKQGRYVGLKAAVWNVIEYKQSPKGGA